MYIILLKMGMPLNIMTNRKNIYKEIEMTEYIERAAVERMLEAAQIISDGEYCGYCTEDVRLSKIPSVDVGSVRHGRWETKNGVCTCSVCGSEAIGREEYHDGFDYLLTRCCPNCGVKMKK